MVSPNKNGRNLPCMEKNLALFREDASYPCPSGVVLKWVISCLKRGLILSLPMFFMGMLLLDILTQAHFNYGNIPAVDWLKWMGAMFYLVCLWNIFFPFHKIRSLLLFLIGGIIVMFIFLNPDLKKIYQHSKCLEDASYPCPSGVVLKGG